MFPVSSWREGLSKKRVCSVVAQVVRLSIQLSDTLKNTTSVRVFALSVFFQITSETTSPSLSAKNGWSGKASMASKNSKMKTTKRANSRVFPLINST